MNNPEKLAILSTQDTGQNKRQRKPKGNQKINNPETQAALGSQDTGHNKRQRKPKGNQE